MVIHREVRQIPYPGDTAALAGRLDRQRGVLLSSSFEFPGRYTRWDCGFIDPPLMLVARGRAFSIEALNARGEVLIETIAGRLRPLDAIETLQVQPMRIDGTVHEPTYRFPEELRSRQPSVFSVLRAIVDLFGSTEDRHLGLYGGFGYDLVFQFEPMTVRLPRAADQRDLVLFLPVLDRRPVARDRTRPFCPSTFAYLPLPLREDRAAKGIDGGGVEQTKFGYRLQST
jgi:anthranilate synthase